VRTHAKDMKVGALVTILAYYVRCGAIPTLNYTPGWCGAAWSTSIMSASPYLPAKILDATIF
jgi:hypothetical protein